MHTPVLLISWIATTLKNKYNLHLLSSSTKVKIILLQVVESTQSVIRLQICGKF